MCGWAAGLTVAGWSLLPLCAGATSTYMGNNRHTGYVPEQLPTSLAQQWVVETPQKPDHAWLEPYYMQQFIDFDYVDHTCAAYGKVYFGSSADGAVRAVSVESGEPVWTFYTEAAIRFAPIAYENKIYFVSDDGYLYCVDQADGSLVWKKHCAPLDSKCVGNDRVVSLWPMRSGVIVENGKLYTTCGMWSRDGVVIYCLDPKDGSEIWRNDTSGFHYEAMPHGDGFGGVSPQGPLAISGDRLYVPCGRAAPAYFDANTGEFIFHENGLGYKPHYPGGSWIMQAGKWLVFRRRHNHVESELPETVRYASEGFASGLIFYNQETGEPEMSWTDKNMAVVHGNEMILAGAGDVIKVDFETLQQKYLKFGDPEKGGKAIRWDRNIKDSNFSDMRSLVSQFGGEMVAKGSQLPQPAYMSPTPYKEWAVDAGRVYAMMIAGDQVFLGGENTLTAVDLKTGTKLWVADVKGWVRGITVEGGRVLASTTEGRIYCFGENKGLSQPVTYPKSKPAVSNKNLKTAGQLLAMAGTKAGYALVLGTENPELIFALLEKSQLVLCCYTDREEQAAALRKQLDGAGVLGTRCNVFVGDKNRVPFAKYMFNAVFAGGDFGPAQIANPAAVYKSVRPYDGKLVYMTAGGAKAASAAFEPILSVNDSIKMDPSGFILTRGALVGSGEWTAPFADMGRTSNSEDDIVRAPLGILWWGGPGARRIMSRHWVSPVPLFVDGTLLIQGRGDIMAVDAYNGREIWDHSMSKVGRALMPMRGGNIVADHSYVYCVKETTAYALDLRTGETVREFTFEADPEETAQAMKLAKKQFKNTKGLRLTWEYLGLMNETLIGTLSTEEAADDPKSGGSLTSPPLAKTLFVFDVKSGRLKWTYTMDRAVVPTAIVADSERIYVLDRTPENDYLAEKRRGQITKSSCSLKAIDLSSGKLIYETTGLALESKSLMLSQGVVVALPNPSEVVIPEASRGLSSYDAKTGKMLWDYKKEISTEWFRRRGQQGYFFINGNTLYTPFEFDLKTGTPLRTRDNPITGEKRNLAMEGLNFCGGLAAGKHIAVHRSSSVGYTDLDEDRGSFWLPEIRSSCWVSMLPVGGIVVSQEGTSSCTCSYSYKTSLALVPVEREENWTIHLKSRGAKPKKGRRPADTESDVVNYVRLNFGAPGDWYDETTKNMWFSYPRAVAAYNQYNSQFRWFSLPVKGADKTKTYHLNANFHDVEGTDDDNLFLTGIEGNQSIHFALNPDSYQVRLMFAEVQGAKAGERIFDVLINGKTVLQNFDIAAAAGENTAYTSEPVTVNGAFDLEVKTTSGKSPLIAGIEVIKQK